MGDSGIKRYSMDELVAMNERGEVLPTSPEAPTVELDEQFWQTARVVMPSGKASVHLRIDTDVLDWFKSQGKGHLTRMNAVLRSYVEAHRDGTEA